MPRKDRLTPTELLERYNPALGVHHLVTPSEWSAVGDLVREAARPFTRLAGEQVRDYLRAMTKLTAFAHRLDGPLTVEVVLAPWTIRAYLDSVPAGARDEAPYLWRLAREHQTVEPDAQVRTEVGRRPLSPPYTVGEVDALLATARALGTRLRRTQLLAVVVLGAGCGLVRQRARVVTAADVHPHDDGLFVRAAGSCSKVRSAFESDLAELRALRPVGPLVGPPRSTGTTHQLHAVLDGRRGIPHLSVDRLRATYLDALLRGEASIVEVFAWSGLKNYESLARYIEQLPPPSACPGKVRP